MERLNADFPAYHARVRPDSCALVDGQGMTLSYAALDRRIGDAAAGLRDHFGIKPGARVALLAGNHAETFVLQFACQRLGAILAPLHLRGTDADLRHGLNLITPMLLLHDEAHEERARACSGTVPCAPMTVRPGRNPVPGGLRDGDATSLLLFTSGTTGWPKAVRVTNRMLAFNAQNMAIAADIDATAVHPVILPLYHAAGFNLYASPVFLSGGTVVVPSGSGPNVIFDLIEDDRRPATHIFAVPTIFKSLSEHARFQFTNLSNLRVAGVGGDAVSKEVLDRWAARGIHLRNGYGMTEAGPAILAQDARGAAEEPLSVGRALFHVETRLRAKGRAGGGLDQGELQVRGPAVMPGYWNDPEASADAFEDGWLKTGDIARSDPSGRYSIVGRIKEIFISGGENIHPSEIEAVLAEHPSVEEAAAFGMPDAHWGQVCWAAIRPRCPVEADDLLQHCAIRLPRYKLPRRIVFRDAFPRNALGKVDRSALRAELSELERSVSSGGAVPKTSV